MHRQAEVIDGDADRSMILAPADRLVDTATS